MRVVVISAKCECASSSKPTAAAATKSVKRRLASLDLRQAKASSGIHSSQSQSAPLASRCPNAPATSSVGSASPSLVTMATPRVMRAAKGRTAMAASAHEPAISSQRRFLRAKNR